MEGKREKVAVLYWLFYDVLFFCCCWLMCVVVSKYKCVYF